jgi:hypothetical protein
MKSWNPRRLSERGKRKREKISGSGICRTSVGIRLPHRGLSLTARANGPLLMHACAHAPDLHLANTNSAYTRTHAHTYTRTRTRVRSHIHSHVHIRAYCTCRHAAH